MEGCHRKSNEIMRWFFGSIKDLEADTIFILV